jgi:hypothetical protein
MSKIITLSTTGLDKFNSINELFTLICNALEQQLLNNGTTEQALTEKMQEHNGKIFDAIRFLSYLISTLPSIKIKLIILGPDVFITATPQQEDQSAAIII